MQAPQCLPARVLAACAAGRPGGGGIEPRPRPGAPRSRSDVRPPGVALPLPPARRPRATPLIRQLLWACRAAQRSQRSGRSAAAPAPALHPGMHARMRRQHHRAHHAPPRTSQPGAKKQAPSRRPSGRHGSDGRQAHTSAVCWRLPSAGRCLGASWGGVGTWCQQGASRDACGRCSPGPAGATLTRGAQARWQRASPSVAGLRGGSARGLVVFAHTTNLPVMTTRGGRDPAGCGRRAAKRHLVQLMRSVRLVATVGATTCGGSTFASPARSCTVWCPGPAARPHIDLAH
jgi:hypothetical protein